MGSYGVYGWILATLFFVVFVGNYGRKHKKHPSLRTVAIIVLGDIGRSQRMMYHAESFAKAGFNTVVIGYKGI